MSIVLQGADKMVVAPGPDAEGTFVLAIKVKVVGGEIVSMALEDGDYLVRSYARDDWRHLSFSVRYERDREKYPNWPDPEPTDPAP